MEIDIDEDPFPFFLSSPSHPDTRYFFSAARDTQFPDSLEDEDNETYISDWMNANIEDSASRKWSSRRRTRSVSPNRQQSGSEVTNNYAYAAGQLQRPVSPGTAIAMLRKWIERMEKMYIHKKSPSPVVLAAETPVPRFPISPPATPGRVASPTVPEVVMSGTGSQPLRGRKRVRRTSKSVGNRAIRSQSGHIRVWREPAEDMYPLSEEEEYEEVATPVSM
jgi:hypothetical protein